MLKEFFVLALCVLILHICHPEKGINVFLAIISILFIPLLMYSVEKIDKMLE